MRDRLLTIGGVLITGWISWVSMTLINLNGGVTLLEYKMDIANGVLQDIYETKKDK